MNKRIHYIDNLRWITVSLLIVYHAALAYNTWGEANYIFFEEIKPFAAIVSFISPWFMPLMFLLAGVSARFSLQKRSMGGFIRERFLRIGIPFVFGLIAIDPILSFIADVSHNSYGGNYFEHYGVFFSKFTDLTGYDGGFTLGHFWFLGVLMIVSLLSCVIIKLIGEVKDGSRKKTVIGIVLAVIAAAAFDISFFGKRIPTYLCVFLLGYYIFSDRDFVKKLSGYKLPLTVMFLITCTANTVLFIFIGRFGAVNTVCNYASFVFALPAIICIGHDHLDFTGRFSGFNSKVSYMFYILHFPAVILCQYFLSLADIGCIANFFITAAVCYPLTYLLCILVGKTRYIRVLFGSRPKTAK